MCASMHYGIWVDGALAMLVHQNDAISALNMAKAEAQKFDGDVQIKDDRGAIVWTPTWERAA